MKLKCYRLDFLLPIVAYTYEHVRSRYDMVYTVVQLGAAKIRISFDVVADVFEYSAFTRLQFNLIILMIIRLKCTQYRKYDVGSLSLFDHQVSAGFFR
jgi:hypothetical protein